MTGEWLGPPRGAASALDVRFPGLLFKDGEKLERRFEDYKWANSAGLATKVHAFMAFAWTLGLMKVLKWVWASAFSNGAPVADPPPVPLPQLLAVVALQLASIWANSRTALRLFAGIRRSGQRATTLALTAICTAAIRCCMGRGFDQLFAGMAFSGLFVPAAAVMLAQVRLARALPVHLINFACYAGLVLAQWSGALELGMELRPLLNCAQFLAWVVLLPIAIASILEARERRWCLEFEDPTKAQRALRPYWSTVLALQDATWALWCAIGRFCRDVAVGLTL